MARGTRDFEQCRRASVGRQRVSSQTTTKKTVTDAENFRSGTLDSSRLLPRDQSGTSWSPPPSNQKSPARTRLFRDSPRDDVDGVAVDVPLCAHMTRLWAEGFQSFRGESLLAGLLRLILELRMFEDWAARSRQQVAWLVWAGVFASS